MGNDLSTRSNFRQLFIFDLVNERTGSRKDAKAQRNQSRLCIAQLLCAFAPLRETLLLVMGSPDSQTTHY